MKQPCLKPYQQTCGAGANLVLLHGWGLHGGIWQNIVPALAKHFKIYNIDLPGFGLSPVHNGEYSIDYLVDSVIQQLPEKCYLMGWSLGGLVAMAVAIKEQQRIEKLICVASTPCFVTKKNWPHAMPCKRLNTFIDYLLEDPKGTLIRFLSIQTMGSLTQKVEIQQLKAMAFLHGLPAEKALIGGLKILRDVDLTQHLNQLQLPLLNIYGQADRLIPAEIIQPIAALVENSQTCLFERSAHLPFLSEREFFVRTTIDFLNQKKSN